MGEKTINNQTDEIQMRKFTRAVLNDLLALERMLADGMMEENAKRIGAEQEMFLVDSAMRPAGLALDILKTASDPRLTTELGLFNLEANLTPLAFGGNCLSRMEDELSEILGIVETAAERFDAGTLLAGILPTIRESDLIEENMTPCDRYRELSRIVSKLHGGERLIHIKGLDEYQRLRNDIFLEFCNTSFQVHLQVGASEFANRYNWAQAIAAPVLAAAVNSPLLLGHRLWQETRLAVFQHATDTRSTVHQSRSQPPRVNFGDSWLFGSILEMFYEDVARFRILFTKEIEEDAMKTLAEGRIPQLAAWRLHNGTIWRWNRACYGITDGRPGLRIEARFLPSGPTVADEMANAAFFLGLMEALPAEFGDVSKRMKFDDAKHNFFNAARCGLKTQIVWLDGRSMRASRLILEELLPRARYGLHLAGVDAADVQRYLGIIEERVKAEKTGAQWMLDSLSNMDKRAKQNVRFRSLTAAMKDNQEKGLPVHKWQLAEIPQKSDWIDNYRTVEQFMSTDLFTVRPEDVVDLAASLMHWKHVRHVPVEDDAGHLVGIVSHRDLLALLANGTTAGSEIVVSDIMKRNPIVVSPETTSLEALNLMREKNIGCLPVIRDRKLIGLLTAHDFLTVSAKLFEERLRNLETAPAKPHLVEVAAA